MKFEHLIEINDILNPLMDTISREQLWRGLVLRAEQPTLFMPHLDACEISARSEGQFQRRLRFGELVIEDTVHLRPLEEVRYEVPAQGEIPASSMSMTLEMPAPQRLFVRFRYDDGQANASDSAARMYEDFKRSAYQEADIDTIRILRELASEGKLDGETLN